MRRPFWCSLPLAFAAFVAACVVMRGYEWKGFAKAAAIGLLFVSLMMLGLRLLVYLREVEPQYWQAGSGSSSRCRKCGYHLKGNRSGVCPECGELNAFASTRLQSQIKNQKSKMP